MNINYHYYAIKTIARWAGLEEPEAQFLATYSQFVDDYDIYASIQLDTVPDFAKHLAKKNQVTSGWTFYPVTTGFNSLIDMSRLLSESNQKLITVPFHFIPRRSLKTLGKLPNSRRDEYRTQPAREGAPSLMLDLLRLAYTRFRREQTVRNKMFIGMLLHTLADTYAHQNFSGFKGWENECVIRQAINTQTRVNLTSKYNKTRLAPAIGHAQASHAPDDTYLGFHVEIKSAETEIGLPLQFHYNRENLEDFTQVSYMIYHYLCNCFNRPFKSDGAWIAFRQQLWRGFMIVETDRNPAIEIPILNRRWHELFPNYEYHYASTPLLAPFALANPSDNQTDLSEADLIQKILYQTDFPNRDLLLTVKDENFFYYNVLAKEIRDQVNGETTPVNAIAEANA